MYLLGTDYLSTEDKDTIEAFNLGRRLAAVTRHSVAVTILTYSKFASHLA